MRSSHTIIRTDSALYWIPYKTSTLPRMVIKLKEDVTVDMFLPCLNSESIFTNTEPLGNGDFGTVV